jgi:hypothetical protein
MEERKKGKGGVPFKSAAASGSEDYEGWFETINLYTKSVEGGLYEAEGGAGLQLP